MALRAGNQGFRGKVPQGGRIVIEYYSDEDFSRLFDRLTGGNA